MLGSITGSTSMDAFDRMQEKVESLEAGAEVRRKIYETPLVSAMGGWGGGGGSRLSVVRQEAQMVLRPFVQGINSWSSLFSLSHSVLFSFFLRYALRTR